MRLRKRPSGLTVVFLGALLASGCAGVTSSPTAQDPESSEAASGQAAPRHATQQLDWIADDDGNVQTSGRFFSPESPWNQRVDSATPDPNSARMLNLVAERVGVIEQPGNLPPILDRRVVTEGLFINTSRWTTPVVSGGPATQTRCRQDDCGDPIPGGTLPIPESLDPDPEYDGWFTVLDGEVAFDLWRARRESDGAVSYHFARSWDLHGLGFNEPQTVSARGSGLPLFAGLITRSELSEGRLEHALAIALPGPAQRSFVAPASATDGNGRRGSLPLGARIRLRADATWVAPVDDKGKAIPMTAQQQRLADALVVCLRTFGAIVVERSAVPTLYAQRDVVSDLLVGNELQGLTLQDFEVVTLGTRQLYPPKHDDPDPGDAEDSRTTLENSRGSAR